MFQQTVHLRHARTGRDQHQRPVRQLGKVGVAKGQLDPRHTVALQLLDQAARTVFTSQHVQLLCRDRRAAPMRWRTPTSRRFTLDHQVLPGVITRWLAGRSAQADPPDITTHFDALAQLAGKTAHRQLTLGQHAIPEHHARCQRLGHTGMNFAVIERLPRLHYLALDQQSRANMAVAIATALWALVTQALCRIEYPLARQGFQHRT